MANGFNLPVIHACYQISFYFQTWNFEGHFQLKFSFSDLLSGDGNLEKPLKLQIQYRECKGHPRILCKFHL